MKIALFRLSPLLLLSLLACNGTEDTKRHAEDPANSGLIYASGWDLLKYSDGDSKLDSTAHFEIARNDCGWPAYGALDLEPWNELARLINQASTAEAAVAEKEPCFPWPDPGAKGINSKVELLNDGKVVRVLYFTRYDQVCAGFSDQKLAKDLLDALQKLNVTMTTKECPNGWGSS